MTCKDCLHFALCEQKDTEMYGLPFSISNDDICEFFNNKSKFIELPFYIDRHTFIDRDKQGNIAIFNTNMTL